MSNKPKVPKCPCGKSDVIENMANGNKFFYCRSCKKEVSEIQLEPVEYGLADYNDAVNKWLNNNNLLPYPITCPHYSRFVDPAGNSYCLACHSLIISP